MEAAAEEIGRGVIRRLQDAWNAGDGAAFGEPFADDADFVDIRGIHHRGREAIVEGHRGIFATIYRGSRVAYELEQARALGEDVVLAHSQGTLFALASAGPMAGEHRAMQSLVLVRRGGAWEIAGFHNTLVMQQQPGAPATGGGA